MADQTIPVGTILFRAGDPCPGFVVLKEGTICVTLTSAGGREIVLYRVRPGEVCLQTFACLIENRAYSAEGVAESNLVAEIIPPTEFNRRVETNPQFRAQVFSAIAHRFSDFEQLVEDVALTGLEARLAKVLLRLADTNGVIQATHERLAVEAGSGRAVVSRQLAEWVRKEWVELSRGEVRILRADTIRHLAGDTDD